MGAYNNPYFEIVIGIFMLLFGINFNLYYFLLVRRFRDVFRSEELWAYVLIVAAAVAAITLDIVHMYESVGTSLRHAFFQVSSIITTTGYATVDFNTWPTFSKAILVALMFIGGCAGSTAGGIKVARVVILQKVSVSEMRRMLHPNAVPAIQFEGKPLNERSIPGRPSVSGGVPDGLRGVLPVGVSGAVGPGDHVHSGGCLHQQRGARSGDCRSHG